MLRRHTLGRRQDDDDGNEITARVHSAYIAQIHAYVCVVGLAHIVGRRCVDLFCLNLTRVE